MIWKFKQVKLFHECYRPPLRSIDSDVKCERYGWDMAIEKCYASIIQVIWVFARPWWRHEMEILSTLLAICAGNSPASCEFPAQRPVTWSFGVFFDLCLNKRLRKQSWGRRFETLSRPLWRHCNAWEDWHISFAKDYYHHKQPDNFNSEYYRYKVVIFCGILKWTPHGSPANTRSGLPFCNFVLIKFYHANVVL